MTGVALRGHASAHTVALVRGLRPLLHVTLLYANERFVLGNMYLDKKLESV